MRKLFSWLDNNILGLLAGFLLVFIPLFPKWPLFDVLPGYIVRARLEDIFVAFALCLYLVQLFRRKVQLPQTPVVKGLLSYLVIGFVSVVVAIVVVQTIPLQLVQIEKAFLHWLRRVEYFTLFFLFFTSIRSSRIIRIYFALFFMTFIGVIIYGFGQKYLYWPAFSTMNREFSKGWWLYLTEHARVLSTFGGHYDLAGYLVMTLTLSWSLFFGSKKWWSRIFFGILLTIGFWLLILTASRISFGGYMVGLAIVVFLWTFKKGLWWGITRGAIVIFLSLFLMLSFGDLSDRFTHLFKVTDRIGGLKQLLTLPVAKAPTNQAAFLENNIIAVTSKSDTPPTPSKPLPVDVNKNAPPLLIPSITASGSSILVEKPRTYSQNAVLFDLSTGIRLDATWPRAINGFKANPLTGSGYGTLTRITKDEFTEAESTDNDFLRALGETGLFGFIAFFGTIILMGAVAFRALGGIDDPFFYGSVVAFIGYIFGLILNSMTIDIFEASKVAYVFWGLSGLTLGSIFFYRNKIESARKPLKLDFSAMRLVESIKKLLISDRFWVLVLVVIAFVLRTYKLDTPLADWHSWRQADTSAVSRGFIGDHKINWLYPTYEDLSSIASGLPNSRGLRFVEFPIYNAATFVTKNLIPELNTEEAGRVTTALASVLSLVFVFLLCRKLLSRRIAYLSAIVFAVLPYNIFYSRTILPDPTMVMLSLGGVWFALKYLEMGKKKYLILTFVFSASALLVKPYAVFILGVIGYFMLLNLQNKKRIISLSVAGLLAVIPLVLWRNWISQYPEAIPANSWLFNGNGIRFKGAFWYWLFADRIGRLILGFWGLVLFGFGVMKPIISRKYGLFPFVLGVLAFSYLAIFATGNVQHDYYQILLIPSLSILVALGLDYLINFGIKGKILAVVSFLFMVAFGWYFVKDYYNINHPEIVEAGRAFEKIASNYSKATVIAPYQGDTAFLYQTTHKGWPIMEGSIEDMIKKGADYYVSVNYDQLTKDLIKQSWVASDLRTFTADKRYKLIEATNAYVIIQLVPDNKLPK